MIIIHLLGSISDGERLPKKIRYNCSVWEYDREKEDYLKDGSYLFKTLFNNKKTSDFINDKIEIISEILDKEERKYLEGVIKPFEVMVRYIKKRGIDEEEYIHIKLHTDEDIELPFFKKGTMYRGMIEGEEYEKMELGLFEEE